MGGKKFFILLQRSAADGGRCLQQIAPCKFFPFAEHHSVKAQQFNPLDAVKFFQQIRRQLTS